MFNGQFLAYHVSKFCSFQYYTHKHGVSIYVKWLALENTRLMATIYYTV